MLCWIRLKFDKNLSFATIINGIVPEMSVVSSKDISDRGGFSLSKRWIPVGARG